MFCGQNGLRINEKARLAAVVPGKGNFQDQSPLLDCLHVLGTDASSLGCAMRKVSTFGGDKLSKEGKTNPYKSSDTRLLSSNKAPYANGLVTITSATLKQTAM